MAEATQPMIWSLVGAETMRALDRYSIDELGIPGDVLMESAGRAVAEVALEEFRSLPGATGVRVVCGAGNNGGDGLVVARHVAQAGVAVLVELVADEKQLSRDASRNLARARAVGVRIAAAGAPSADPEILVDALFGTGLARAVQGAAAAAIEGMAAARAAGSRVVSVDIPSGLDADTGQALGIAVVADRSVAIGLPKLGLTLEPGRSCAGRICVARIGIADSAPGIDADASLLTSRAVAALLPARPAAGHKGSFGHVLVVAGSEGKTGAAALAVQGALRSGAGLVTLACPEGLNAIFEVKCTEALTVPVPEAGGHVFAAAAVDPVRKLAGERDAVVFGPGIGAGPEVRAFTKRVVRDVAVPLVLDAEGLTALVGDFEWLASREAPLVLTPHPGEAARMLERSATEINADRVAAARELAARSGAVVLLKGAGTLIVSPRGRVAINATGGPALATGGTGDVLAGLLGGLLAQGMQAFEAAVAAAHWHGVASDRLVQGRGEVGITAGELAAGLPEAREELLRGGGRVPAGGELALPFPGA
jgi:NAD(P)H-hydrate epimerase